MGGSEMHDPSPHHANQKELAMEPASTSTTTPVGLFFPPPPPPSMPAGSQGTDVELGYKNNYERFVNPPPYQEQEPRDMLYPTIGADENRMRWGLIRKVYSILFMQLLLTVAIAGVVVFYRPLASSLVKIPGLLIGLAFLPLILLCPLYYYHQKHPINLLLLALFTASISVTIGITCAFTKGEIIWESALLTTAVVVALTIYTFWASRRGYDFSFLGPFLFSALIILILFILIQVFFPLGKLSLMIYGGLASLVFSAFIIYDTDNLIKRYSYDEYVWASVSLYLDIMNLFLALLSLFNASD